MSHVSNKIEPFEGKEFLFRISTQKGRKKIAHPHWHENYFEFIKVIHGNVLIHVDNEEFIAHEGDIILVNTECVHAVYSIDDSNPIIWAMVFDKSLLTNTIGGINVQKIYSIMLKQFEFNCRIQPHHTFYTKLNAYFEDIHKEHEQKELFYENIIKSHLYEMIVILIRSCKNELFGHEQFAKLANDFLKLTPVFQYIEENYSAKITLDDLASTANMSKYHFSRFFKSIIKMAPKEYVNQIRMNKAITLLSNTDLLITEIAEKTGFCNVNYFGTKFKEKMGISPKQYKNQHS